MKVFISWSGDKSLAVAKVLKEWIPCIIQDVQPYFSSDDIDKGARWSTDIAKELEEATFGILCVTRDNLNSQWLNFEAGALSKAIDKSKVCPFLLDLKASDITDSPILQFQMANTEKDDMFKLFKSINKHLSDGQLEDSRLEKLFNAFWPDIDKELNEIMATTEKNKEETNEVSSNKSAMFEEMLELLRSQQKILRTPEQFIPKEYLMNAISSLGKQDNTRISAQNANAMMSMMFKIERMENKLRTHLDTEVDDFDYDSFLGELEDFMSAVVQFRSIILREILS